MGFDLHVLDIDPAAETERIVAMLRHTVNGAMHRRGAVVGISGGVDSSVVLALSVRTFGPQHVAALMLPEQDSEPESEALARCVARQFGVEPVMENITPALAGFGCYERRDEAIRRLFPEYDARAGYKVKIGLPHHVLEEGSLNIFSITVVAPDGEEKTQRLRTPEFYQIVAASNFKQRTRMAMLYYHAELHNYATLGTANKDEHELGFFVKHGDAGVDVQPIVHLYKTQVYQLAAYLDVPETIRRRIPTSDTYSAHQSQEEFFFRLPFKTLDLLWFAQEHQVPVHEVAAVLGLEEIQVTRAFADFTHKRRTTAYLRLNPVSVDQEASTNEAVKVP